MTDWERTAGNQILEWYGKNKRDLPWRQTKDPYRIWVSEIMLQQTRVDTVIGYYHRFLQRFPSIAALAEAKEEEVLSLWQGLGYYSRARNLHRAARLITDRYGGQFPHTYEEVRSLPGIGDYTAGAILSIAFDQPYAAVDGNVLRVITRLTGLEKDITRPETKKELSQMVRPMIPLAHSGDFSQGLMELGALVCLPLEPLCDQCPVQSLCTAYATGRQNELPVRKKRDKPLKTIFYRVAVIQDQDCLLLEHRRKETLLGQMWGFPLVEEGSARSLESLFWEKYGLKIKLGKNLGRVTHIFTHQVWQMDISSYLLLPGTAFASTLHWIPEEEQKNLAIPTAFRKVLQVIKPG
ncbi:A/G-specific adenine glycosylase [Candidatus Formimonas warabiya]|nr:A/G-specific adenine glycosylase [Candidatus Formimonas warabiya]